MKQRPWSELGQALKALRTDRDFGQKEVIGRSGEGLVERTLRIYESGEQRPSRERLLKFLTKSFDLNNSVTINRYLKLAGYAALSGGEVQQLGLDRQITAPALGRPVAYRLEVSTLVVIDGQGREVWRHQFPSQFAKGFYEDSWALRRCAFADLDGDGGVETLFVYFPLDFGSVGATLFCFSEDGSVKWEFAPGKAMYEDTGREYLPPYFISNVRIVTIPNSAPRILVSSNHHLYNANQIAMLDVCGNLISEYWHSGHLLSVVRADIDDDGTEEILLGGVNNGYGQATVVIFDPRNVDGVSEQPGRQIIGCGPGTERAVVLFPRTCLSQGVPYNRVQTLWVTKERRLIVVVVEGVSESNNPGVMIYELDLELNVISARPDSHLQEAHLALQAEGVLDHFWTEEETERLRREVRVIGSV